MTDITSRLLATDLDGTLIPLENETQNASDLRTLEQELQQHQAELLFVTGRHLASVLDAMDRYALPKPAAIICDVGTSIYTWSDTGSWTPVAAYQEHLGRIVAEMPVARLRERLSTITGLTPQEDEKQGSFKLSYYVDSNQLDQLVSQVTHAIETSGAPYSVIGSVDPFNNDGLIDLLPSRVSKAHALDWWTKQRGLAPEEIVFAGDSGNDLAALTAGYRAIVVSNASRSVANDVYESHRTSGWKNRLCLAQRPATSGVLEGCRWFGLASPTPPTGEWKGALPFTHNQTAFRVWAPSHSSVAVKIVDSDKSQSHPLAPEREQAGWFSGSVESAGPHTTYRYQLGDAGAYPDPVSRSQPQGVHGPSEVIHPQSYAWQDQAWQGMPTRDLVIYELHIGTFTEPGTFRAAIEQIPHIQELGATAVEIMPVAQTPGKWNWGYDGVNLFAPRNTYGSPNDMKAFVNECHQQGLAVLLDVVYNHLGPEGNYLPQFGPYSSAEHHTPWGDAFNFDGPDSEVVRQFVVDNALYWLDEFHLDGLRLDAAFFMIDDSTPHLLTSLRDATTNFAEQAKRVIHLIAETNAHDPSLVGEAVQGEPYDAIWCDCLMHSIYSVADIGVRLVARSYHGQSDMIQSLQHGFIYAGNKFERQPAPPESTNHARTYIESFVTALQTHDSVGNHPQGKRLHHLTSKSYHRAAITLTMLYPSIPLMFMGEEVAADSPFPFFVDFEDPKLRDIVDQGRQNEYPHHVWDDALPPSHPQVFHSALCHDSATHDGDMLKWYQQLIAFRKQGLQEQWLAAEQFTAGYSEELDAYWLKYPKSDGTTIAIYVRLASVSQTDESTRTLNHLEELLLSSKPASLDGSSLALGTNHGVVVLHH
ncbi:malto-oligosyltrehalose trehalohydrolase [Aeoliella mucimassa]|uniref:Malto-oligosyltrehalose trehalohydrolase n=1 Tax=Aeoliella mucimassa TaxID=2527972 RepID=A0A518AQF1_9BACT|nr:malto-oligosyltrehalose trehalohydrolase [Aeoliella mucimassa]QDU56946.1 Malto-oligosyltrehalose trehalohydrolase [Aeoliella mucimassa]